MLQIVPKCSCNIKIDSAVDTKRCLPNVSSQNQWVSSCGKDMEGIAVLFWTRTG